LEYINLNCGDGIVAQMRQGKHPVRVDMLMGRKTNPEPYHTFIGKDAVEALREYFEKERGWPAKGEPIWISKPLGEFQKKQLKDTTVLPDGRVPVLRDTYRDNIRQLSRRIGLIPKQESHARGVRYGYNPNEIRDVARSVSRKATSSGFDIICAEFWMGHTIDPLGYDKLQKLEPEWSAEEYHLAEPYFNIISNPPGAGTTDLTQTVLMAEFNMLMRRAKLAGREREFITTIERNIGTKKVPRMVGLDMDDYYRAIPFDAAEARTLVESMQRAGPSVFEKTIEDLTAVLEQPRPARRRTKRRPEITEKVRPAKKRAENRRQRRSTARNGGTPVDCPYETRIVDEQELLPLLNQGWDVVRELASGKVIVRRQNGLDE
jgi:hypothetical protein